MYNVRFDAREVWGEEAPANDSLRITLWDDYIVPA
jgi:nitrile hydratase